MRIIVRALVAALLVGLVGLTPGSAVPVRAAVDTRSTAKVVVIVGAVHGSTSSYRAKGQAIYDEAIKWSSNVVKVFSPNATWAAAKAAMQGASIVVYAGHGNGFPSPYRSSPWPYSQNGMGLNATAGNGDYNVKYYGEYYIGNEVDLAPNAVVLLTGLCYSAGNSEGGQPEPTIDVAMQRVDNYAAGFLRAGARAVVAEPYGGVTEYVRQLLTGHRSMLELWLDQPNANGNEFSFPSIRSPGFRAHMDPVTPTSGFRRAFTGDPNLRTEQVSGLADTSTAGDPAELVAPGNAEVAAGGASPYWDSALTDDAGPAWAAGTALRVEGFAYGPAPADGSPPPVAAVRVRQDGSWWSAWVAPGDLIPRDSAGPHVAALAAPVTLTPDGDGTGDSFALELTLSEPSSWTAEIRTSSGQVLADASGSGSEVSVGWDGSVGGVPAPVGSYRWEIRANDGKGNAELDARGIVAVDATVTRLAGQTMYDTSAAISAATFDPGVATVYITTGQNFPTAVAGAAAAGWRDSPMLLTMRDSLPTAIVAELQRLKPGRIIVLGPTTEVSDAVKSALAGFTTGAVLRVGGSDRYAVAANISKATFKAGVDVAYIATGLNFPDALAGSAAAAVKGGPILLVDGTKTSLPAATVAELARLAPKSIVVLGGIGVVPDVLFAQLDPFTTGSVLRHWGQTLYGTAAAVSKATYPDGADTVYIATGLNFPDALSAATMMRAAPGPLLLVTVNKVPVETALELVRLNAKHIVILGGTGVVSEWAKAAVRAYTSR